MKKPLFTLLLVATTALVFSQQIAREEVLMEIGTGTWCGYCPGAAMGAHDMITNGHDVAVIEYHSGDVFETTESDARIDYYNITGFPTCFFDGLLSVVGGSATQSMYSSYLPKYQQRIVIPSSFAISVCGDHVGSTYDVTITMEKLATYTGTNLKAHLCITETDIPYSWQNQTTIDYCMRDMVPTDEGTSISFSGSSVIELDLSFTLDNTWETDNCELIAFIQDDDTKEVLQCVKVMVPDLYGCEPVPAMNCSDVSICVGGSTQFFDNTMGNEVTRLWQFEGGAPATSTEENPVVTYNTDGYYDVTLIVGDGTGYYDTLTNVDYIEVKLDPTQCSQPVGPDHACSGQGQDYTTNAVPYATSYTWTVDPPAAGSISGTGTTAIFYALEGYTGSFSIKARAENECSMGAWSEAITGTVETSPEVFEQSTDGGYCNGSNGAEILLYGSEAGITYELFIDDETTGVTVTGTGDTISFGYFTQEGIYTSLGSNTYCNIPMSGMTWVHEMPLPGQPDQPAGPAGACSNTESQFYTSSPSYTTNLIWSIDPAEAGTVIQTIEDTVIISWNIGFAGTASVSVSGENSCGLGPVSNPLQTAIYPTPMPVITGEINVCENQAYTYSTIPTEGNTYEWTVTGGTITEGAGTNEITILWGNSGNGSINLTETSAENCVNNAEEFLSAIIVCTGVDNTMATHFKLYPNPSGHLITIEFMPGQASNCSLAIMDTPGQIVYQSEEKITTGKQMLQINIEDIPEGYYIVVITTDKGEQFKSKFIKE